MEWLLQELRKEIFVKQIQNKTKIENLNKSQNEERDEMAP
jgi:hypothetical protein